MKRILSLALVFAYTAVLLAGCNTGNGPEINANQMPRTELMPLGNVEMDSYSFQHLSYSAPASWEHEGDRSSVLHTFTENGVDTYLMAIMADEADYYDDLNEFIEDNEVYVGIISEWHEMSFLGQSAVRTTSSDVLNGNTYEVGAYWFSYDGWMYVIAFASIQGKEDAGKGVWGGITSSVELVEWGGSSGGGDITMLDANGNVTTAYSSYVRDILGGNALVIAIDPEDGVEYGVLVSILFYGDYEDTDDFFERCAEVVKTYSMDDTGTLAGFIISFGPNSLIAVTMFASSAGIASNLFLDDNEPLSDKIWASYRGNSNFSGWHQD